ncbi:hypothetical protein [Ilumatobacter nonamiensis]|uniref:hypothetical protein n=1 Tax=Ilumatobacter nonamiensis TaxID=467093 RepID=UPI0003462B28|nr:hypothetical protein [Ilumatobacter nonamiensis]
MKLLIGFIAGVAVGGYLASNMTDEQRSKVGGLAGDAASTVTQSKVGSAVADNASKVSDKVTGRVAGVVDTAGDKLADTIDSDDTAGNGTTVTA